ncbi:hypothetical protein MASR1M8_24190 [Thermomonas brevis]
MPDHDLHRLERARRALWRSYLLHIAWFAAMVASALWSRTDNALKVSALLALLTVPPVIWCAWRVHLAARRIDPSARTLGLGPMLLMTVLLTPFESGLIVPAKNLHASAKVLRQARSPAGQAR